MRMSRRGAWKALGLLIFGVLIASSLAGRCSAQVPPVDSYCVYEPPQSLARDFHIVLLAGDEEYRSEEAMPMLGKILSQRHGFRCTVLFSIHPETGLIDPTCQTNVPGMEALETADLVIMAWRFRSLPDEQMKHFVDYVERGKPIIGLRTSTHAFQYPGDSASPYAHYRYNDGKFPGGFGRQILGETWVAHHGGHGSEATRGIINEPLAKHPVLRGVEDIWGPSDVYTVRELPAGSDVLVYGQVLAGMERDSPPVEGAKNDPMMPLVWARTYRHDSGVENQVVCTTMGAATDFVAPGLRRIVVNSSYWLLGLESEVRPDLNVDFVGEFQPTPFGFGRYQKGLSPRDFDLAD